ncbi:MAG: family 2 glycosyl transferase [Cytophagales bacterium CG18_big_fil_WC_8_21_14_2_50_42_9]|nr:MAG: family 2 glycosyl transferase [Cytophagales bacterium CG18_big_fil_WC_8_21_14_2_50_42_9]
MIVSLVYFILFFGIFLAILVLQKINQVKPPEPGPDRPLVSILIAVRNEELNIIRCLQALSELNYPPQQLEVLIGDDASTDNTYALIQEYIRDKPQFTCIPIREKLGQAKGKGNVLAHLSKHARSKYFFITDADIAVPPNWIQNMLAGLKGNIAIVTGMTTITGDNFFYRMQALDWINALGLMQVVSDLKLPVSTMGNNMLITRQAYEETGGYENMPFSVTEDIQLFRKVMKRGHGFLNIYHPGVLAFSTPARNITTLLNQRKRWMQGIWYLPWYVAVILIIYASFYFFCFPFRAYSSAAVVAGIFFGKFILQTWFNYKCLQRLGLRMPTWNLLIFEFYVIFVSLTTIIFFLLPFKVRWKERKY